MLRELEETNLVRIHYDDNEALYEFGNQPHLVLVCKKCPKEVARRDVLFSNPNGPFVQWARSKEGGYGPEPVPLLQLIQATGFVPITYRFEVLGYCRAHASKKALRHHVVDFLNFLLSPEKLGTEFKGRLALETDKLVENHLAMVKLLTESPKVGAVAKRIIDPPAQFLADNLDSQLTRLDADIKHFQRMMGEPETPAMTKIAVHLVELLYARWMILNGDQLRRVEAGINTMRKGQ